MATEIKKLSYFPLDTQFFENEKIEMLMANFGFEASGIYLKLLCKIYTNGFYMQWNETICKVFAYGLHSRFNSKKVQQIVDFLLEFNFFNKEAYLKYQILTSKGIQLRFFEITSRRKSFDFEHKEYLLVPIPKRFSNVKNEEKGHGNVVHPTEKCNIPDASTHENVDIPKQSKGKESKVNNERESARAKWNEWIEELLDDEAWRCSAVQQSGAGITFNAQLPRHLDSFCNYLVSSAEESSVPEKADFVRRFHYWWQYHGRKQEKEGGKKLSKFEQINQVHDEALAIARQMQQEGGFL